MNIRKIEPSAREKMLEEELASFLYIIAHDLGAPIRHAREFSKLLVESIENPNEEQQACQGFIQGAANKLDSMIKATLHLSRLTTAPRNLAAIESAPMFLDIIEELSKAHADIEVESLLETDLPKIFGDAVQVRELFRTIIENSFVHHEGDHPLILNIRSTETQDRTSFEITDNGKGIDENLQDSIYKLFYKLKPNERPEAAGTGLTIAKKIIDLHGGDIDHKSTSANGTTFVITLPA